MNTRRRRQDRPVVSVSLKVTFRGDRKEVARIREAVPAAVPRRGGCEVEIEARGPEEVAELAKGLLEKLRGAG